jgi:hypothetical protein
VLKVFSSVKEPVPDSAQLAERQIHHTSAEGEDTFFPFL